MKIKKSFKIIFAFIIIIVFCCSCDGNVTRDIRHAGYSLSNDKFVCDDVMPKNDKDQSYKRIKYFKDNYFITEDGEIYDISLGLKYSNDQNCVVANTSVLVDSVFGDIAKGKDGGYYYLTAQNNISRFGAIPTTDMAYQLYVLLLGDSNNLKVQALDNNIGSYLVLKTDGNVYKYIVSRSQDNKNYVVISTNIMYSKDQFGDYIVDFSYKGNNLGTFIKTDSSVYRMKISNYEECNKYADVSCTYEMMEDQIFVDYRDKILAFNGSTLITTYGRIFSVTS